MNDTRMLDLVRAARGYLYTEELISDEEYAHLAALPSTESHERMRGYDDLRAQLAAVTRERNGLRDELEARNTALRECEALREAATRMLRGEMLARCDAESRLEAVTRERDSWHSQRDEVHAEMERQTQLKREERQAKLDAQRERDGYHEALEVANAAAKTNAEERDEARADAARLREALKRMLRRHSFRAIAGGCCLACENAEAALASAPSAEPTRAQAERWLNDGPEEAGGTLAFHAEPTPRDMRVAKAVRGEASDMVRDADDGVPLDCLADSIDAIDLVAVVAKAVKP